MVAEELLRVLQDARFAHKAGDFLNSLKFYQQFFEQSLHEDPEALYAIRLNHCLDGWAALADEFPGAKQRLEDQQQMSWAEYLKEGAPERFHDYLQISSKLGKREEAIQLFKEHYLASPKQATRLVKFVWNDLVEKEEWAMCNELLESPKSKLEELFAVYDEAQKLIQINPEFDNTDFRSHVTQQFIKDLKQLITVINHGARQTELKELEEDLFNWLAFRSSSQLASALEADRTALFKPH